MMILVNSNDSTGRIYNTSPVFVVNTESFPATADFQIVGGSMYITIRYLVLKFEQKKSQYFCDVSKISDKITVRTIIFSNLFGVGIPLIEARTVNVSGGSFGETTGLISLEFIVTRMPAMQPGLFSEFQALRIVFPHTTITFGEGPSASNITINQNLTIGGTTAGQTLRFFNLPTGGEGLPAGTVWRDSQGFLRIV